MNSSAGVWFVYVLQAKRGNGGEQKLDFKHTTCQYFETGNDRNPEKSNTGHREM